MLHRLKVAMNVKAGRMATRYDAAAMSSPRRLGRDECDDLTCSTMTTCDFALLSSYAMVLIMTPALRHLDDDV